MDKSTWKKPKVKTPDSLRKGAGQGALAPPTLRYGPVGDSAPPLRLKAAGMAERFPFGPDTARTPFPLVNSAPLRIGPDRSRARSGKADP